MSFNDFWHKQLDKPLFPDLLWSRPENRIHAGKLLIIGGHAYNLNAPATAYTAALAEGAGTIRTILPDRVKSQLQKLHRDNLDMEFAPSTPSGSFAIKALADILEASSWADAILVAGDLGRNSETAVLLEKLVNKTTLPLILTKDAADYFTGSPNALIDRGNTCLVINLAQLQKLATAIKSPTPITSSMGKLPLITALHELTSITSISIMTKYENTLLVADAGKVSSTDSDSPEEAPWRIYAAAHASVWWMQNIGKTFEALTTAAFQSS